MLRALPCCWFALLLTPPVWAADSILQEGLPAHLAIDGDLSEWASPPSLLLGAGNQVAGTSKVHGPDDLSARIWVALSPDGLVMAGEVTDDKVLFPAPGKVVNADHVELWLALPGAPLPPLAFAHQLDEVQLRDTADCEKAKGVDDVAACRRWVTEQKRRRLSLERLHVRQYLVSMLGVQEAWATPNLGGKPAEQPIRPCCGASEAVVQLADKGWRFEARIGLDDLPPTTQVPLTSFRVMVDLVDADEGINKLETFLSSAPRRKFGKPETFNEIKLRSPLLFESAPPLLATLAGMAPHLFYFPGKPVQEAFTLENVTVGYQYSPTEPSPSVLRWPLGELPRVAELGDVAVHQGPASASDTHLWTFRADKPVDHTPAGGTLHGTTQRPPGLHFFISDTNTFSALGTGACGSCPLHELRVVALDRAGRFDALLSEEVIEQTPLEEIPEGWLEGVSVEVAPDFSRLGFKGTLLRGSGDGVEWKRFWRWDAAKGKYVRE